MATIPNLLNLWNIGTTKTSTPSIAPLKPKTPVPTTPSPTLTKPVVPIIPVNSTMSTSGTTTPSLPKMTAPAVPTSYVGNSGSPALSAPPQTPTTTKTTTVAAKPVVPAVPKATTPAPNVTTASGTVVNPNTGGVVADAPAAPTAPVVDPNLATVSAAEKAYQDSLQMSPEELAAQEELSKLNESYRKAYLNAEDQAIPMEFITGQQASLERRALSLAEPLQDKMARLQAKRLSSVDASKFALERADKAESAYKTDVTQKAKDAEDARRFGLTFGLDEKKVQQSAEQNKAEMALAEKKFEEDKRQFGLNYALEQRKVAQSAANKAATAATATQQAQQASLGGLSLVNDILKNGNYKAISGGIQTGIIPFTAGATTKNQYEQLKGMLSLGNRQQLKGSGAISDFEAKTLDKAASDLGRNQSENDFKNSLNKIRGVFATSAGMATPVKITDPKSGKSQILEANRTGIEQAVRDGLTVDYQ